MNRRLLTGLAAGIAVALAVATPAEAAPPEATVVHSSATNVAKRLAVHKRDIDVIVSEKLAKKAGWPPCGVGTTVSFEAAPDEVEVGGDGTV